jgi:hypothetical protein
MTILDVLDQYEIDMILEAIRAQEKKCKAISKRPIQGFRAGEREKLQEWAFKAEEWAELESKIAELSI